MILERLGDMAQGKYHPLHKGAPIPENESSRILSLARLKILDTKYEEQFDRITRLTQRMLRVPVVLISLVDKQRQWFKSCLGLKDLLGGKEVRETPRDQALCAYAILSDMTLIVPDTLEDERFKYSPLVLGPPNIRFYAGAPLKTSDGYRLGTLCLIDSKPRTFSSEEDGILRDFAVMVVRELENRSMRRNLKILAKIGDSALSRRSLQTLLNSSLQEILYELNTHRVELLELLPVCPKCFKCEKCGVVHIFRVAKLKGRASFAEGAIISDCYAWYTLQSRKAVFFNEFDPPSEIPFPFPYLAMIPDPSSLHLTAQHDESCFLPSCSGDTFSSSSSSDLSSGSSSSEELEQQRKYKTNHVRRRTSWTEDSDSIFFPPPSRRHTSGHSSDTVNLDHILEDPRPVITSITTNDLDDPNSSFLPLSKATATNCTLNPVKRNFHRRTSSHCIANSAKASLTDEIPVSSISTSVITKSTNKCVLRAFHYESREFTAIDASFLSSISSIIAAVADREHAENEMKDKKKKVQQLLQNILPKEIIHQLQLQVDEEKRNINAAADTVYSGGDSVSGESGKRRRRRIIAEKYDYVSILFIDIVGFTELSGEMEARELVQLLNQIFSLFDDLTEKHGLEKIKTIGDAYMVVGGVPTPMEQFASCYACASMALDVLEVMQTLEADWKRQIRLKIGLHSGGPVVAGVIGSKKFSYDLWGDTVNVASRMETYGQPSKIHCSASVHELLAHHFSFESREPIFVKGKGIMNTYFLGRKKPSNSLPHVLDISPPASSLRGSFSSPFLSPSSPLSACSSLSASPSPSPPLTPVLTPRAAGEKDDEAIDQQKLKEQEVQVIKLN